VETRFKELKIVPAIGDDPRLLRQVESASRLLESVVGRSAGRIRAVWEPGEPGWIRLRLDDPVVESSVEFPATELQDESRLRRRLSHLWSHLLGRRVDVLLEPVLHPTDLGSAP
jgi:hypothetical protein